MSYRIEKYDNEPIVVAALDSEFSVREHSAKMADETVEVLDAQNEPVFLIMDIRDLNIDLEDILFGASLASRQMQLFKHENVRTRILVTGSRIMTMSAQGLQSPIFGGIQMDVVKTLDEALAFARSRK